MKAEESNSINTWIRKLLMRQALERKLWIEVDDMVKQLFILIFGIKYFN